MSDSDPNWLAPVSTPGEDEWKQTKEEVAFSVRDGLITFKRMMQAPPGTADEIKYATELAGYIWSIWDYCNGPK